MVSNILVLLILPKSESVGIDLGIKDLAVCSDGNKYKNINKNNEVKKIEKKNADYSVLYLVLTRKIKKERNTAKTNNVIKKGKTFIKNYSPINEYSSKLFTSDNF